MPDLMTTFAFVLEIDSVEIATFRKCSGIESETETIEFKEATKEGKMMIRKAPGAMKWSDITLERRVDATTHLWDWRQEVINGNIDDARRNGSIVVKDSLNSEVARWNFYSGWPSKYTGADFDAGANEIAAEKIVITHEGLERA
ncbi:phage tail protein [Actinotalea ferrariae]|uniref:phage tail protein n=1 Tax=Actinotalea ferrariae TaxID=1386098 RepID=UPI001C8BF94A|nr:phage tail protein [Actinotalea ferrariae]MBX9243967.1 phage tail protein [Actinotalea ferrariae]